MWMVPTKLKARVRILLFWSLLFILPGFLGVAYAEDAAAPDYRKSIEEKSKELEEINNRIKETYSNLNSIANQKNTLNNELRRIDHTLNQVNLGIKATEVNIDKLSFELLGLEEKIIEVEEEITNKRDGIAETILRIHKVDKDGLIQIFLRNESLVQGAFEFQALRDVQSVLSVDVTRLEQLKGELGESIAEVSAKKNEVEREKRNLTFRKDLAEDQKEERKVLLANTKNKEQVYQKTLSELEKRQEEIAEEIEKLEFELRGRIDADQIPPARPGVIAFPVPGGVLTQGYGKTKFALSNYRGQWHNGIDIGKFLGAEIVAAEDGIVVAIGDQDQYCRRAAYGKFIVIRHFNGLTTLYAHLSGQKVKVNQEVKRGELIGYMGRTGWATGPHLHFVVYDSSTYSMKASRSCGPMPIGGDLDPRKYI